ncbi:anthranilate phosphoribosyltransferase [Candidatus Aerophobetes bacterium]|uniref:Anthranilate phosphoribosyltransferase n=1 Tax=Aerophobetes bacterium TaxID=2030807 RepID=A0A2A4YKU8_UNCAE|nr:MAG: anthranilate phosphoribosyltransferase [Candidatus Aerophobetes bacterium]
MKEILEKLVTRTDLSEKECSDAMHIMLTEANLSQSAAFLALLHAKGPTSHEIAVFAKSLRNMMIPVHLEGDYLDIVGTGGDNSHSVNISTGAAIVAASCGVRVAKHGARASSSKCGSADVLEGFGVPLEISPDAVKDCLDAVGITFMYAPCFHPAWKSVRTIRKDLQIRTVFNILGPLVNPARVSHYVIGVYHKPLLELVSGALIEMHVKRSCVFHGCSMDELSPLGPSHVIFIEDGVKTPITIDPIDYNIEPCSLKDLRGGDVALNMKKLASALKGIKGPIFDAISLNAALAIYVYGIASDFDEALKLARDAMEKGKPYLLLQKWIAHFN